ncbi:serine/threonine-protein kinase VRK1 isoform X3 [Lingula anatina]|uniref:Serine/threonine-protein kinase VRK1 isoform X3 n=1 Tax=Lingula anatina TaxID=7574 RepID=A0A2R2MLU2_LINAN|nr:serine/threonine-protein kinase VRK1 isoform X3 [Lingula anatina]|eukprot:XP_023931169.1 serine/threonine-protein kinase VRK1 isoform X3 [Lingula anatina]
MPPKRKQAAGSSTPAKKARATPKAYQLAAPLPEGTILADIFKRQWKVGKAVGSGGFGLLYSATSADNTLDGTAKDYVVKIEPHGNGPLFCELAFYQRVAKPDMIDQWKSKHKIKVLGVPKFIAMGSSEKNGTKYRFMIMERFGEDLQKKFERNGKRFPTEAVYRLGLRMLDALEYIHSKEYVHADIKASNMLEGFKDTDQVYLVDYGLAFKFSCDGKHKEYKEDPRKAHDGTIEFTSRDAHVGAAPSRRGDIEILGYCLLQWLCGRLPWESNLENKDFVRDQKLKYMEDIPSLMKACFPKGEAPAAIAKYLQYVSKLDYAETPDYDHLRKLMKDGLKKCGAGINGKLNLGLPLSPKGRKRESDNVSDTPSPKKKAKKTAVKSPKHRVTPAKTPVKSPRRTPAVAKSPAAVKSPRGSASKAKSPGTSSPRHTPTAKKKVSKQVRKTVTKSSIATQTSPGLKGLRKSRQSR